MARLTTGRTRIAYEAAAVALHLAAAWASQRAGTTSGSGTASAGTGAAP